MIRLNSIELEIDSRLRLQGAFPIQTKFHSKTQENGLLSTSNTITMRDFVVVKK